MTEFSFGRRRRWPVVLASAAVGMTTLVGVAPGFEGAVAEASGAGCSIHKTITKGVVDNYSTANGAEPAQATSQHESFWTGQGFGIKDFDEPGFDEFVAVTFDDFEIQTGHEICAAALRFAARDNDPHNSNVQGNDSVGVHFIVPAGSRLDAFSQRLTQFDPPPAYADTIDLGAQSIDYPGLMQSRGYLDAFVQDDTEVDFLELTISTRPLITIDKTTNGLDEATVAPGSLVTWTYTITNHSDAPAQVASLVDSEEGAIGGDRCDPSDGELEPGQTMTCTLTGTAGEDEYCNVATAVGVIEGFGEFQIDDTSCYTPITTCEGNLITNPGFEDVSASPSLQGDEDIAIAAGWGPIWMKPSGGSTGDVNAVGDVIPSKDPTPQSGNYAVFWADNSPSPSLLFREGIMNQLDGTLNPNSGATKITFTTTQVFEDDAEIGIYGVYEGAPALGAISTATTPRNEEIFGVGAVVLLGTFTVDASDRSQKITRTVPVNTDDLDERVDRIFITRVDDPSKTGRAFVTYDDFCMQPPVDTGVEMLDTPGRLMDTRAGQLTADGVAAAEGRVASAQNNPFGNGVYRLPVAGRLGIAADASTALLNVAAVRPSAAGFLTVFPCNGDVPTPPLASSLNFGPGETVANNVTVGLDGDGDVCIFASAETDVVVDVAGTYNAGSTFRPATPTRFLDTREGGERQARDSVVEVELDLARIGDEWATEFPLLTSVAVNVTAVRPAEPGFLTAFPCDEERPNASSVNYRPGDVVPNGLVVGVSTDPGESVPKFCIYASGETHVLVDVVGASLEGSSFEPVTPARFLDTRSGNTTFDGEAAGGGVVRAGTGVAVQVGGRGGVPAGATAVTVNLTAVRPATELATGLTSPGFITAYPGACGEVPLASNINLRTGDTARANGAVISLPVTGEICVYASRDLDIIVDVLGFQGPLFPPLAGA